MYLPIRTIIDTKYKLKRQNSILYCRSNIVVDENRLIFILALSHILYYLYSRLYVRKN